MHVWARVVLGWVTSWEVLVLRPLHPFLFTYQKICVYAMLMAFIV